MSHITKNIYFFVFGYNQTFCPLLLILFPPLEAALSKSQSNSLCVICVIWGWMDELHHFDLGRGWEDEPFSLCFKRWRKDDWSKDVSYELWGGMSFGWYIYIGRVNNNVFLICFWLYCCNIKNTISDFAFVDLFKAFDILSVWRRDWHWPDTPGKLHLMLMKFD